MNEMMGGEAANGSHLTVGPDSFLTLHYRLADEEGSEHVSTFTLSPATLQMGSGQLAEPLERCLLGLAAGDHRIFALTAGEAFGPRNPRLVERIALSALPPTLDLKPNSLIEFNTSDGHGLTGFLRSLDAASALFDFNHPLAGKSVTFEVEIIAIL